MWETKVKDATKNKDALTFSAEVEFYKDGQLKYTYKFENMSEEGSLKKNIIDQLNQYKKIDELKPADLVGPVDLTPPPDPLPPPDPTKEEREKMSYFQDVRRLEILRKALSLGMIDDQHDEYVTLSAKVKDNCKPEYIDSL